MTDQRQRSKPTRVTVYGSCVSRDAVDLAGRERLTVVDYIARQSLISAGHDSSSRFPREAQVSSAFQRRMMEADFRGDLWERLRGASAGTDVLLWDLTDERHGVHLFEDGTVVTRSIDLIGVPEALAAVEDSRHLAFGTEGHFERWTPRAREMHTRLGELGLLDRTVVLQVPWAMVTPDGRETPPSMGTTALEANTAYRRYYEHLDELGFELFELQPLGVLADPGHRWGLAPFHYTQDVYDEIIDGVLARLG